MGSVTLSRRAQTNLRDVADWIARDSPDAALAFVAELRVACAELGEFPRRYPTAPQIGPDLRKRTYRSYHIIYRIHGDDVVIVAVVHAARDPNISF